MIVPLKKTGLHLAIIMAGIVFSDGLAKTSVVTNKQNLILEGIVTDEAGNPLPAVSIYVEGTFDGTISDIQGAFRFERAEMESMVLVFSMIGFATRKLELVANEVSREGLNKGEMVVWGGDESHSDVVSVRIRLSEQVAELAGITLTAGAMATSDEYTAEVLQPLDIVTTSSAFGDITGAFQSLPGAATVAHDGRLFVRGGDANETALYIDGMEVAHGFGSMPPDVPTRSRFQPELFKGAFFSTGGYSTEYGQALSSVLVLNSVDWPLRNQTDVHLSSVGAGARQTIVGESQSISLFVDYTNMNPYYQLIPQDRDWEKSPENLVGNVSLRTRVGKTGLWKAYAHTETGRMRLRQSQPGDHVEPVRYKLYNTYTHIQSTYRHAGNRSVVTAGIAYSDNDDDLGMADSRALLRHRLIHSKVAIQHTVSNRISMKSGAETRISLFNQRLEDPDMGKLAQRYQDESFYAWSEIDYVASPTLTLRGGVRAGYSRLSGQSWLDPRVSLAWKPGTEGQFSIAAGRYQQFPDEEFRLQDNQLKNPESRHLIFNYYYQKNARTFRAESFYKAYDRLLTWEGERFGYEAIRQMGSGFAYGADLFYRDRRLIRNTDVWISYSYIQSKRRFGTFEGRVQPSFAPRHNLSVVAKRFIQPLRSQLGVTLVWNDGYPYTDPHSSHEQSHRTKSYLDLSIGWSYLPRQNVIIHLASSNLVGRSNIFGYRFASEPGDDGAFEALPVGQVAPRFIFAGVFITFSKDASANMINNF